MMPWFDPSLLFINGQWQRCASGETLPVTDPSNGAEIARIARGGGVDVDAAVQAAQGALEGEWGAMTAAERGRILFKLGHLVLENADALAEMEATDVGKPLTQARGDVTALARYCEFYGGAADKLHGQTIPFQQGFTVYTLREPHGVTGHIIPWNYPMQIIGRSIGAALATGNACVLKPAEEACLTALAFADLAHQAGLPPGALNVVPGLGLEAGAALTAHPGVRHLSFTGSVATGRAVQIAAAENIVPVTLELGGKSPQLVFADADLDKALPFLVNAGIQNAGQTCSAGSRILVQRDIHDELAARLSTAIRALTIGPAMDDANVGPMVSMTQKTMVNRYLAQAKPEQILAFASRPDGLPSGGSYLVPTLIGNITPDHPLAQEEIFGPVLVLIPFDDEDDAIRIANGTKYGLVASVWSADGARQMRLAKRLNAGQVFLNNYGAAGGVELPFGGTGHSGHGREKGFEALYAFTTVKTVAAHHG